MCLGAPLTGPELRVTGQAPGSAALRRVQGSPSALGLPRPAGAWGWADPRRLVAGGRRDGSTLKMNPFQTFDGPVSHLAQWVLTAG